MVQDTRSPQPGSPVAAPEETCRKVGRFIAKGGSFALHDADGSDIWLEMHPIPLHLVGEDVEITGQRYGLDLIWVTAIGPPRGFS